MDRPPSEPESPAGGTTDRRDVLVRSGDSILHATLDVPEDATGIVLFAHGTGSSRLSPRNRYVARILNDNGLATLLVDLLTRDEERVDLETRRLRFDVVRLARRLVAAIDWTHEAPATSIPVGLFGASTGAAAALVAAAERPDAVRAVVSRGGRPDLAADALALVRAPTLLIVGGDDEPVIELNRAAMRRMAGETRIEVVPGASHLFEERGALERVAQLAAVWLRKHVP
jgi:putative phosphoribosyl transferase